MTTTTLSERAADAARNAALDTAGQRPRLWHDLDGPERDDQTPRHDPAMG